MANEDHGYIALPKLYGAPAYARPPAPVARTSRPFDPDELPLEAARTEAERELASALPAMAPSADGNAAVTAHAESDASRAGRFRLPTIAARIRGVDAGPRS